MWKNEAKVSSVPSSDGAAIPGLPPPVNGTQLACFGSFFMGTTRTKQVTWLMTKIPEPNGEIHFHFLFGIVGDQYKIQRYICCRGGGFTSVDPIFSFDMWLSVATVIETTFIP